ncbi:MAG: 4'-phosphopantetheinyl transferase superfamily protein [Butyrivibrio sp.]|nr:4'-phosphopantetheinyl transferase superfamily protein [Acetatifactor muris]MCM1558431.1 4'-phosphopantetheinyl transferase superfamily protein [Butyrivibrio sp.]
MKIYLLNIGELIREEAEFRAESLLHKVDETRRKRILAAKTGQGKAAELGAGLLLQRAVLDWQADGGPVAETGGFADCAGKAAEADSVVLTEGADVGSCILCTLSGLLSGLLSDLSAPLSLTYRYGETGKPYFVNMPLYFNLSHSGEYVLCAVSSREVGADIQRIQSVDVMKLAKRFFSEPECRVLERCESVWEQQRLFFELWSRKEAYGKLTGEGITAVLKRDMQTVEAQWQNVSPPEGYAMAVCTGLQP